MTLRSSGSIAKRGTPRRKIALACERCREKKIRCDGQKPTCGPCSRRGYTIEGCIYKGDNARSASNDEYLKALLSRIKELEDVCAKAGVSVASPGVRDCDRTNSQDNTSTPVQLFGGNDYTPGSFEPMPSNVTAMGAMLAAEDGERIDLPREEFYGSSSAASFMRLARQFMSSQSHLETFRHGETRAGASHNQQTPSANSYQSQLHELCKPSPRFTYEDYSLPPRPLADHLLHCYWDRVYCLYPFFHRPSFERAYENLWKSNKDPKSPLPELNIGLGSAGDSGPRSIVFYCALNTFFAMGCQFSDIPPSEREAVSYSFFLRAKTFVGLDMLDIGNISVVQVLLNLAVLLQGTPYPTRCWNSIGVACRVAQGIGLQETIEQGSVTPLEREIRRRTWHGCVMMDMVVSMTYGRPTMTSHLSPAPLPLPIDDSALESLSDEAEEGSDRAVSHMTFYVATIELYKILENILSDIYNAWRSRSSKDGPARYWDAKQGGLDVIIEIDNKLITFEANLTPVLDWSSPPPSECIDGVDPSILACQRNVLRARFIHLRLLLCRPIFTQICSERTGKTRPPNGGDSKPGSSSATPGGNILYTSVFTNCAVACVMAAVDLISLVHDTYKTPATDAWWYNGFYVSTAGFVLIMSYTCRSILDELGCRAVDEAWRKCEEILKEMSMFSACAKTTLQLLQATYCQVMQHSSGKSILIAIELGKLPSIAKSTYEVLALTNGDIACNGNTPTNAEHTISGLGPQLNANEFQEGTRELDQNLQFSNYFSNMDDMGLVSDEFGFLGRFDLPDISSWFSDIPV